MSDLCDLLGHGPADMGADPVPQSECLVCQLEAKDKRIAELEKTNAQLNHDIGEYVDETARLRAAIANAYEPGCDCDTCELHRAAATEQEGE